MTGKEWKTVWKNEEDCARIEGWDFSHIAGRYEEEEDLPWDYEAEIRYLPDGFYCLPHWHNGIEIELVRQFRVP